jgi:hypothetical protein
MSAWDGSMRPPTPQTCSSSSRAAPSSRRRTRSGSSRQLLASSRVQGRLSPTAKTSASPGRSFPSPVDQISILFASGVVPASQDCRDQPLGCSGIRSRPLHRPPERKERTQELGGVALRGERSLRRGKGPRSKASRRSDRLRHHYPYPTAGAAGSAWHARGAPILEGPLHWRPQSSLQTQRVRLAFARTLERPVLLAGG